MHERRPFVGRARELARLTDWLALAGRGSGSVVVIAGEAGIGKTALVDALHDRAKARVLRASCLEDTSRWSFQPWRTALLALTSTEDGARCLADMGAAAAPLTALVPSIRGGWPAVPLAPQDAQVRLFESLARLLHDLAARGPLLLLLEDLHWSDDPSLELLRHLLNFAPSQPWLIVLTIRDPSGVRNPVLGALLGSVARLPRYERIDLVGLSQERSCELFMQLVGETQVSQRARRACEQTSGVPFYICELARSIVSGESGVPQVVGDATAARLQRLTPAAQSAVRLAACVEEGLDVDTLTAGLQKSRSATLKAVTECAAAGFLRSSANRRYAIPHAILRAAILAPLLSEERAETRRAVARALQTVHGDSAADQLAALYHATRELRGAGKGFRFAVLAAEEAESLGLHRRAAEFLQMARDLSANGSPDIARRLALAYARGLSFGDAVRVWRHDLSGNSADPLWAAQFVSALKQGGAPASMWEPVVEWGLRGVPQRGTSWARLQALRERLDPLESGPWYVSRWHEPAPPVVAILRATGLDEDLAATVHPWSARTESETRALLSRARSMQPGSAKIGALDSVVRDLIHRHADYVEAKRVASELLDTSMRIGHLAGEAEARYELAKCEAILGDLVAAREMASGVPPLVARLGSTHRLRFTGLAALNIEIGYFAGCDWNAIRDVSWSHARDPGTGASPMGLVAMAFAAFASAMLGERQAVQEIHGALHGVLQRLDERAYQYKQAIDLMASAAWHLRAPEHAVACRVLASTASAASGCAPITCTHLSLARMAVLEGNRRQARRRYEAARAWALARRATPLAAIALWEGSLARGARRGVESARAQAETALGEFRSLAMTAWIADAERVLTTARQFPDGLTQREAEILATLAAGLSNKEIAAKLGISAATVQRHLANAYRKIEVSNRAAATAYVLRHDLAYMAGLARTT